MDWLVGWRDIQDEFPPVGLELSTVSERASVSNRYDVMFARNPPAKMVNLTIGDDQPQGFRRIEEDPKEELIADRDIKSL
jgi:hypothetical protein